MALLAILLLVLLDMQNLFAGCRRVVQTDGATSDDYTIVVPLYGHPRYFANRIELEPYRGRVLLALDTSQSAMAQFADELQRAGWRVHRSAGAPSLSALLAGALAAVTTTWSVRLD